MKAILFDFDGVILDSMPVREYGFRKIFEGFCQEDVERLIRYHNLNGGLSRFHKIKYFYNEILKRNIDDGQVNAYANQFSEIMKLELTKKKYLMNETVHFIQKVYQEYSLHIVSGSEEKELKYLCDSLGLSQYFKSIHGSPTKKNNLVKMVLENEGYDKKECVLIGDSLNDYEAAKSNGIKFYGYNNEVLVGCADYYIESFRGLRIEK